MIRQRPSRSRIQQRRTSSFIGISTGLGGGGRWESPPARTENSHAGQPPDRLTASYPSPHASRAVFDGSRYRMRPYEDCFCPAAKCGQPYAPALGRPRLPRRREYGGALCAAFRRRIRSSKSCIASALTIVASKKPAPRRMQGQDGRLPAPGHWAESVCVGALAALRAGGLRHRDLSRARSCCIAKGRRIA